jgi:plasmid replication initiation protein
MPNPPQLARSSNELNEVRKSNQLIEARYRLTLGEQRLILHLCSLVNSKDEDFKSYEIRVQDFARMFGLENKSVIYKAVEDAAKDLAGKRLDLSRDGKEIYVSWLSYVEYIKGSGVVKVEFHKSLKPYLLQLQEYGNFTKYQLHHVTNFKSQYSIRLYELLKQKAFMATNERFERFFTLENFRTILGIDKNEYSAFDNFRRRVIDPAVEEVSAYTDLEITDIRYGKTGRKITDITFFVNIKPKVEAIQLEMPEEPPKEQTHPIVERLISLGYAPETAQRDFKKYGVKRLERNIAYTVAKQQEGVVKDLPAYLNQAIREDMGGAWEVVKTKAVEAEAKKQVLSDQREKQAELAHLRKMAEMAGVPLETLLPKKRKGGQ